MIAISQSHVSTFENLLTIGFQRAKYIKWAILAQIKNKITNNGIVETNTVITEIDKYLKSFINTYNLDSFVLLLMSIWIFEQYS